MIREELIERKSDRRTKSRNDYLGCLCLLQMVLFSFSKMGKQTRNEMEGRAEFALNLLRTQDLLFMCPYLQVMFLGHILARNQHLFGTNANPNINYLIGQCRLQQKLINYSEPIQKLTIGAGSSGKLTTISNQN